MTAELQQQVLETIRRHRMICAGDRVGAAVSGGADSVALLLLLEELRSELGITLLVMHFNHQLRGESSDADEQFVRELAQARGLEFVGACEDVAAEARRRRVNLEEVARERRYRFFLSAVEAGQANRVAVAHTADDQAETVLARLVRGTGPLGLSGIYPVLGDVVRPLLEVRGKQLRDYLAARGQSWREDSTNLDRTRLRARIRQQLLPPLERDFSPAIVEHLGSLAELARVDETFWSALLDDRFRALVGESAEGFSIAATDLLAPISLATAPRATPGTAEPLRAVSQRLVRRIVEAVKGNRRQLSAQHVEQVVHLACRLTSGHSVRLPGGVVVERRLDRLFFYRTKTEQPAPENREGIWRQPSYSYPVDLPRQGSVAVDIAEIGKRVCLKLIDWSGAPSDTRYLVDALDADLLSSPLILRSWLPGDAYRPKGRRHIRKLKRLLLESRVPGRDRAGWPVLTSAGRLVWARGLPVAEEFAVRAGTRTGLVIVEEVR